MAEEDKCPDNCPAHSGMVEKQDSADKFIDEIRTNHLPHIYDRLNGINRWLIGVLLSVILMLGGIIGTIGLQLMQLANSK